MPPADAADPEPSGPASAPAPQPRASDPDADDPLSPGSSGALSAVPTELPGPVITLTLDTDDTDPPAAGWLEPRLARALKLTETPDPARANLAVVLADDAQMADLHERYTGVAGTTDVLTFDHRDLPANPSEPLHADLVLGRDVAVREAAARGHDARTELLLYAVHGLLHLLGEDDHDPDAYRRMHHREDALLQQLGVGAVFSTSERYELKPESSTASDGGTP